MQYDRQQIMVICITKYYNFKQVVVLNSRNLFIYLFLPLQNAYNDTPFAELTRTNENTIETLEVMLICCPNCVMTPDTLLSDIINSFFYLLIILRDG